jgi:hypothetical protein
MVPHDTDKLLPIPLALDTPEHRLVTVNVELNPRHDQEVLLGRYAGYARLVWNWGVNYETTESVALAKARRGLDPDADVDLATLHPITADELIDEFYQWRPYEGPVAPEFEGTQELPLAIAEHTLTQLGNAYEAYHQMGQMHVARPRRRTKVPGAGTYEFPQATTENVRRKEMTGGSFGYFAGNSALESPTTLYLEGFDLTFGDLTLLDGIAIDNGFELDLPWVAFDANDITETVITEHVSMWRSRRGRWHTEERWWTAAITIKALPEPTNGQVAA